MAIATKKDAPGETMGVDEISGAERLTPRDSPGRMAGGLPKVVWHTCEGANFEDMHLVLTDKKAEPHVLYDPLTDRLGQYFPLSASARALRPGSGTSKNKDGAVVIQVEVCGHAIAPFTSTWEPGPNFAALLAAIRSWDVPDVWPHGRLATHKNDVVDRSRANWDRAGHRGHSNVPDNDHWDPGGIDQAALLTAGGAPSPVSPTAIAEAADMLVGQDSQTGEIFVISGNTKLRLPAGGRTMASGDAHSAGNTGNVFVDEMLRMIGQMYPGSNPKFIALNHDILSRMPEIGELVDDE